MKKELIKKLVYVLLVLLAASIVGSILYNTYVFYVEFKDENSKKIKIWSEAQKVLITFSGEGDIQLPLEIISTNDNIPMVVTNDKGHIFSSNLPSEIRKDSVRLMQKILEFSHENKPIVVKDGNTFLAKIYYGNSEMLNRIKYYPIALILIILIFLGVLFLLFRIIRTSNENRLWVSVTKETAHQIGTPLSSLMGWIEHLKASTHNTDIVFEMEQEIDRLRLIADRFSKIGITRNVKEKKDLVQETRNSICYLQKRHSELIKFKLEVLAHSIFVGLNSQTFGWVIENLVINGIDAMEGKGTITIVVEELSSYAKLSVIDTGKGIPKKHLRRVFEPGFTTKKSGWGIGLSLVKRVVEDYYKGKVKILSARGKGTTVEVYIPKNI